MPGRVIATNANDSIRRHSVVWEFGSEQFNVADYTMWVESKKLNILPTSIAALFVAAALLLLALSARRAKRRKLEARGISWEDRKRTILPWWVSAGLILFGLGLVGWFGWIYLIHNMEPTFQILGIFSASPTQKALFLSCIVFRKR